LNEACARESDRVVDLSAGWVKSRDLGRDPENLAGQERTCRCRYLDKPRFSRGNGRRQKMVRDDVETRWGSIELNASRTRKPIAENSHWLPRKADGTGRRDEVGKAGVETIDNAVECGSTSRGQSENRSGGP
jgi:hypothetical protein